jgi:hypothetical protein
MEDHSIRIVKTDDGRYHITVNDDFKVIHEDIDGPKLLAMLERETLLNTKGEVIDIREVLFHFDNQPVGEV